MTMSRNAKRRVDRGEKREVWKESSGWMVVFDVDMSSRDQPLELL